MKPSLTETFDIEFPLFAFSHCRDVVAAVSRNGGFGVLGAVELRLKSCVSSLTGLPPIPMADRMVSTSSCLM